MKKWLLALLLCCTLITHASAGVIMPVWMLQSSDQLTPDTASHSKVAVISADCPHQRNAASIVVMSGPALPEDHQPQQVLPAEPTGFAPCCVGHDGSDAAGSCENCMCSGIAGVVSLPPFAVLLSLSPVMQYTSLNTLLLSPPPPQLLRPPRS